MDQQQSPEQQVPVVDGQTAYQNLREARAEIEDVSALLRQALADDDQLAAAPGDEPRETR
ncbi:hypothetical protein [Kribbella sp. CA-293567]|uniref:hypothetical protein n=1 Tax=Kribbella sp. CA-293567 TaxID=3002436 RepID=UPI0022DDA5AC|nr:hypothetical protein [Kribbella sp. CA-293567]WBQ03102.1 hypothetical protein OX958_24345 [Kribbella sp. CA-293567]